MFAPPMRPNSAASQHPQYNHQPSQTHHQHQQAPSLSRRRSLSWDQQQGGLPPPPSEIDHYDLSRHLIASPSNRNISLPNHNHGGYQDLEPSSERDTRQLPMNSVSKHPKLKLEVILSSTVFEAGGQIDGRLEITSATSQRLRLGEIAVELEGVEELTSRDHSATQLFLYNRTLFQGPQLPPSNAVLPSAPSQGYWTARKGRTTFPFSFKLPPSAPSSVQFSGNASLRYSLKATCQTWWSDQKTLVTNRKEAFVVEKWQDEFDEKYNQPIEVVGDTRLFMGGNGQIWLEAGISNNLFFSGGEILMRCGIKNNTKREVSGMKVSLARRLIFPVSSAGNGAPATRQSLEPIVTEIVSTQQFKGPGFEFGPNEEIVTNLNVEIPKDVRTIRKTRLFEIGIVALVSLHLGNFAKDLTVEIPFHVAHTASTQMPADGNLEALHPNHPNHPHRHLRNHHHHQQPQGGILQRAASAQGNHRDFSPNQMLGGGMAQIEQYGLDRGWSPAPNQHQQPQGFNVPPPQRSNSAMGMSGGGSSQAPMGWTPSTFLASLPSPSQLGIQPFDPQQIQNQQNLGMGLPPPQRPGSAMGLNSNMEMGMGVNRSASAAPNLMQQQFNHSSQQMPQPSNHNWTASPVPPQRSVSASPGPQQQGMFAGAFSSPFMAPNLGLNHQQQQQMYEEENQQQQQRSRLAHMPEPQIITQPQQIERSRQQPSPQPRQPPRQPPQQQIRQQHPPLQVQSSIPPHQQAPQQSQPESPSYPMSPSQFAPPIPLGLSTIEEDSESQAGTMRSMRGLLAANGASVTRHDVAAFEKMVGGGSEDETPEEKKQREREMMRSMGMKPDDDEEEEIEKNRLFEEKRRKDEESRKRKEQEDYEKSLPKPPVPSVKANGNGNGGSALDQVQANANNRPRASDIFAKANPSAIAVKEESKGNINNQTLNNLKSSIAKPSDERNAKNVQFPDSSATLLQKREANNGNRSVSFGNAQPSSKINAISPSNSNPIDLNKPSRIRTESLGGGIGLGALENRLSSPSPSSSSPRMVEKVESTQTLVMANVGKSSTTRQRHDSAPTSDGTSALKKAAIAAAEREVRAKKEAEEMMIRREREAKESERKRKSEMEELKGKNDSRTPTLAADRTVIRENVTVSKNSSGTDGQRKKVDLNEQRELNKQAVGRVAGWLTTGSGGIENKETDSSSQAEPDTVQRSSMSVPQSNIDLINSPKTPSPSTIIPNGSSFPFPVEDSATASNFKISNSSPSRKDRDDDRSIDAILRRSSYNSGKYKEKDDEIPPTLSADLRALVDSTDGSKARRLGTGLKDHPMNRKLSGSGEPSSSSSAIRRERHTSLPSGPSSINSKGGYPGLIRTPSKAIPTASTFERASSGNKTNSTVPEEKAPEKKLEVEEEDDDEEIKVPSRVMRALSSSNSTSTAASGGGAVKARSTRSGAGPFMPSNLEAVETKPSGSEGGLLVSDSNSAAKYDARSARGGRGGRVASVASLWANIADGDSSNPSAGPTPILPVRPKPRSSGNSKIAGEGGAPALDFSQKKLVEEKKQQLYKTPALKAVSAPHFINTTMPKPVFSNKEEMEKNQAEEVRSVDSSDSPSNVRKNSIPAASSSISRSYANGSSAPSAVRNFSVPTSSSQSSASVASTIKPVSRYVSQPNQLPASLSSSTSINNSISKNSTLNLSPKPLLTPSTSNSSTASRSISPSRSISKASSKSNSNIPNSSSIHEFSAANFRSASNSRRQTVDFLSKPIDEAEKSKLRNLDQDQSMASAGRGTTKPIGKNKLNELRGMFGA